MSYNRHVVYDSLCRLPGDTVCKRMDFDVLKGLITTMALKRILAAAMALACCAAVAGCAPGKDAVVATVDGENIYKWEFDLYYDQQSTYFEGQRGIDLSSPKNFEDRDLFAQGLMEDLTGEKACLQEAKKLGLDQLSEEELAAAEAEYQQFRQQNLATFMQTFASDPDPAARAEAMLQQTMKEKNLDEEKLRMNIRNNMILEKLFNQLAENQNIPESTLRAEYEELLESNKQTYAEQPELYGQQATGIVCFIPEGYIRVKHVLVGYGDEELAKLQQEKTNVDQLMALWATFAIQEGETSASAQKAAREYGLADEALQAKLQAHYTQLKPIADEVYAKAKAGEDFDALIEQYNTDGGMMMLPGRRDGYYMHEYSNFDQDFKDASFALENVGDISEPIMSFYGYHIIKLLEKVESRIVPFEEVKEDIRFQLQGNSDIDEGMRIRLRLSAERTIEYFPENYF